MKTKKPVYVSPEIEIVEFEAEDIIITSDPDKLGGED